MSKTKYGAELSLRNVERLACVLVVDLHHPYVVWYWCWAKPPVKALLFTTYLQCRPSAKLRNKVCYT